LSGPSGRFSSTKKREFHSLSSGTEIGGKSGKRWPLALFGLDRVLTSPDLASHIAALRNKFGYFDWDMLEKHSFSFHTYEEHTMVKSVINGDSNKVNISTGQNSPININDVAVTKSHTGNLQERHRFIYALLAWGTGTAFLVIFALAESDAASTPSPGIDFRVGWRRLRDGAQWTSECATQAWCSARLGCHWSARGPGAVLLLQSRGVDVERPVHVLTR
jgi:hypothetical protein